jgi:hypothetical protein
VVCHGDASTQTLKNENKEAPVADFNLFSGLDRWGPVSNANSTCLCAAQNTQNAPRNPPLLDTRENAYSNKNESPHKEQTLVQVQRIYTSSASRLLKRIAAKDQFKIHSDRRV